VRRVAWALVSLTVLLAGCADATSRTGAPSPSASPTAAAPPTGADALAVIEASAAGQWAKDGDGLGDPPTMPPAADAHAVDTAYSYARTWLSKAMLEPAAWHGDGSSWLRVVDRPDAKQLTADVAPGGEAYLWLNAFAPGWRVVGDPRVSGSFVTGTESRKGETVVAVTWRGTAVYAVEDPQGRGTVVPVFREVTWFWWDGSARPGYDSWGKVGNDDLCARAATGRLAPVPGDLDLPETYLFPATLVRQTDSEVAEQEAEEAACPPHATDGATTG